MKIVGIILGVLLVICGVWCSITPIETFTTLGWLLGTAMVIEGIGSITSFVTDKRNGSSSVWTLVGGIASVVFGVLIWCSFALRVSIDFALAYIVSAWLIVAGVARIIAAVDLRKMKNAGAVVGRNWGLVMVMGVITTIIGIICLFHPLLAMGGVGLMIGIGIISTGLSMILGSVTSNA